MTNIFYIKLSFQLPIGIASKGDDTDFVTEKFNIARKRLAHELQGNVRHIKKISEGHPDTETSYQPGIKTGLERSGFKTFVYGGWTYK